jgi:hypothetical protein
MMMEEFMQMLEELFKRLAGKNSKGEDGNQDVNPEAPGRMPRIKRACASVLAGMKREIHVLEQGIAGLDARRDALIEEYNALVAEIKTTEAEQSQPRKPAPEEEPHGTSAQPERPPEPEEHTLLAQASEAKQRLLMLEQGVSQVLGDLISIKNTGRSKALKKLRGHLTKLAAKSSLPGYQRIAELTSGIEQAIAMLNQTKMIVRAKRLQHLRQNLAELLETAGKERIDQE